MTQRKVHRISEDYKASKKRHIYKNVDNITKNDSFVMSSDINDWIFSKQRDHTKYVNLF